MTPGLKNWLSGNEDRTSFSYDFAEKVPVWKTRWILVCIAGIFCAGIFAAIVLRWI